MVHAFVIVGVVLAGGSCGGDFDDLVSERMPAPSALTLEVESEGIDLSWVDNSETEDLFRVERHVDGGDFTFLANVAANVTTYSDTAASQDTRYTYRVAACDADDCSFSNEASAATRPVPASDLTARAVSSSVIDLSWTDQSATETEFRVERRTVGADFAWIGALAANATTFTDDGLEPGTTYAYRVAACNTGGCAVPTSEASATTDTASNPQPAFPLRLSSDRTWLEYADGIAFNANGDAAWGIFANLTLAEAATYLEDRAAKGVNLIITMLIARVQAPDAPANTNGDQPFTHTLAGGELDFTAPNEAYWSHVDAILDIAEQNGIVVLAAPAYIAYQHNGNGWAAELAANGTSRSATYGTWLGQRYANQPNLIWLMGGDWPTTYNDSDVSAEHQALANAIKTEDPNHLMTAKSNRNRSSIDDYDEAWLDINASYGRPWTIHSEVRTSRQARVMPTFLIEGWYGNEHSMTALQLRQQMYQAVLGGGFGHIYGNAPTWYFGEDASHPSNSFADTGGLDWRNQLDAFGASFLLSVQRLQAARALEDLTPDYSHVAVPAGYDPGGGEDEDYAPVLFGNQQLIAYTRGGSEQPLTVDKSQFTAGTYTVRWYNPRDGSTVYDGTRSFGSGSEVFTPPDSNDWVLLLDDQSLALPTPLR